MKLTRRQLVTVAAGSVVAVQAFGQGSSATQGNGQRDFAKEALDGVKRNADTLSKFSIPLSTEPAFQFRA